MANVAISGLPEQTGKTDNDVLAIVDSGETATSKIKVSTLLDGVGGNLLTSNGTDSFRTPQYATTDTAGDGQLIIGASGSTITNTDPDSTIIGSKDSNLSDGTRGMIMVGGWQNNLSSTGGNSFSSITLGGYANNCTGRRNFTSGYFNTNSSDGGGIVAGTGNTLSGQNAGIVAGTGNNNSRLRSVIIGGENNVINAGQGGVVCGGINNVVGHNRSVVLGGNTLSTSYDNEVVVEHLTISGQSTGNFYNNLSGDTFTIDWDEGNLQKIIMTGDTSLTFSNVKDGATYKLQVENGGTHSITGVTASGFTILCEGGSIPNITNSGVDLCVLEVMGTDIFVRHFSNFSTP